MPNSLVDTWRRVLRPDKSWVLFKNGTCVVVTQPDGDLGIVARAILKEHGHVHPGTSSADFCVVELESMNGWVVTSDNCDILTCVHPDEGGDEGETTRRVF